MCGSDRCLAHPEQEIAREAEIDFDGDPLGSRSATHGATPGSSATRSAQPMTADRRDAYTLTRAHEIALAVPVA